MCADEEKKKKLEHKKRNKNFVIICIEICENIDKRFEYVTHLLDLMNVDILHFFSFVETEHLKYQEKEEENNNHKE